MLHVGAADSVLHVWVNGHAVGISKDSRLEAAFDVTDARAQGREPPGAAWSCAGPTRATSRTRTSGGTPASVGACSSPRPTPRGSRTCTPAPTGTSSASRVARTSGPRSASRDGRDRGWSVRAQLETTGGRRVGTPGHRRGPDRPARVRLPRARGGGDVRRTSPSTRGRPRSPNRYRLVVTLLDDPGAVREVTRVHGGLPVDRDPRPGAAAQRRAGADPGRQPPRLRSRHRPRGDRRADARRPRAHEAVRLQRGAHVTLAERSRVLRPLRRARSLRGRRDQLREPRVHLLAVRRPAVRRGAARPRQPHGHARQEPSVDHHVVARQRVRVRRRARGARRRGSAATTRRARSTTRARSCGTGAASRPPPTCSARCTRRSPTSSSGPSSDAASSR